INEAVDVSHAPLTRTADGATGSNGEVSLTTWVRANNDDAAILTLEGTSGDVFGVDLHGNKARVLYNSTGTNTNTVLENLSWHHAVLTFNNTAPAANNGPLRLYVDGSQVYSASNLAPLNAYNQVLVGHNTDTTTDLLGTLDLYGLYASALTTTDISTLWNSG